MRAIALHCPRCKSELQPQQLKAEWGLKGGVQCPVCGASLRYSPPYPTLALWGSFPLLAFFLAKTGIHEGILVWVKAAVVWFLGSVVVSVLASYVRPPKLKLAPKDDNAPPDLFGKYDA